ncbi:breast carcinoma amplified sequence 2-domain-containing protein, partial [Mycena leptocephala]
MTRAVSWLKEKVDREFARQPKPPARCTRASHPHTNSLRFKNPLLQAELERLDTMRYQLPAHRTGNRRGVAGGSQKRHAQLEHQRMRCANELTLLQTYGANAWRIHNYLLEATVKQTEQAMEELKQMTLNSLETRWTELISNVLQIELANVALDAEVNGLNAREAELAELNNN